MSMQDPWSYLDNTDKLFHISPIFSFLPVYSLSYHFNIVGNVSKFCPVNRYVHVQCSFIFIGTRLYNQPWMHTHLTYCSALSVDGYLSISSSSNSWQPPHSFTYSLTTVDTACKCKYVAFVLMWWLRLIKHHVFSSHHYFKTLFASKLSNILLCTYDTYFFLLIHCLKTLLIVFYFGCRDYWCYE